MMLSFTLLYFGLTLRLSLQDTDKMPPKRSIAHYFPCRSAKKSTATARASEEIDAPAITNDCATDDTTVSENNNVSTDCCDDFSPSEPGK